jgi:hypothetical protein
LGQKTITEQRPGDESGWDEHSRYCWFKPLGAIDSSLKWTSGRAVYSNGRGLIAMRGERRAQPLAYDRARNPINRLTRPVQMHRTVGNMRLFNCTLFAS